MTGDCVCVTGLNLKVGENVTDQEVIPVAYQFEVFAGQLRDGRAVTIGNYN